ncbi:MAG: HEAT repeat domain-containing protein [Verrucomicrobia bacterium]|nr:HEAT repeat domain-containing protein [Verrucomicrobiota bacterium]
MKTSRVIRVGIVLAMALCNGVIAQQAELKEVAQQLQSQQPFDRIKAAQSLSKMRDPEAIALLVKCLNDSHAAVRLIAGAALVRIGQPAVEPLVQSLSSANTDGRRAVAQALGGIGDKSVVTHLTSLLTDSDATVKAAAEEALAKLNTKATPATNDVAAPSTSESKPNPAVEPPAPKDEMKEFKSPLGFSFKYPADWIIATKEQTQKAGKALKSVAPNIKQVNLNHMAVAVYNPVSLEFAENLNIVVAGGAIPVGTNMCSKYTATIIDGFRKTGITVSDVQAGLATVAGLNVMSAHWRATWPHGRVLIRHWQVSVPHGRRTFIVTCSARDTDWTRLEPLFEHMVNSLRFEPDAIPSFDALPGYAKGMIIGAIIGGIIGFFVIAFKKISGIWSSPPE